MSDIPNGEGRENYLPSNRLCIFALPIPDIEGNVKKARSFCRFALSEIASQLLPILCFHSLWMMKIQSERTAIL